MRPYRQGNLDSFCGVYAVVNAYRLLTHCASSEAQFVFNQSIETLAKKRRLKKAILSGLGRNDMMLILGGLAGVTVSAPWWGKECPTLDEFWLALQDASGSLILSIDGVHDHWTAIRSITRKQITLFDSDGLVRLPRERCYTVGKRRHKLLP